MTDIAIKEKIYNLLNSTEINNLVDDIIYMDTDKDDRDLDEYQAFITYQSLTLNTSNIPKYEVAFQVSIFAENSRETSKIEQKVLEKLNKTRNDVWKRCELQSSLEGYDEATDLSKIDMTFRIIAFNTLY